jgi:YD repeat-containing protein
VVTTPGVPASIAVPASVMGGDVNVSWGAASGTVTAYDLDQQYNGGAWTNAYEGNALSKQVSGLNAGSYLFRVRACNTVGGYTRCSGFRTSGAVAVNAPVDVDYRYDALGRLTQVREDGAVKTGYCYDDAGNRDAVIAGGGGGDSCASAQPLGSPTGLTAVMHAGNGYDLSWTAVTGATYYNLKLNKFDSTQPGAATLFPVVQTPAYSTPPGYAPEWVQACDDIGCGAKADF